VRHLTILILTKLIYNNILVSKNYNTPKHIIETKSETLIITKLNLSTKYVIRKLVWALNPVYRDQNTVYLCYWAVSRRLGVEEATTAVNHVLLAAITCFWGCKPHIGGWIQGGRDENGFVIFWFFGFCFRFFRPNLTIIVFFENGFSYQNFILESVLKSEQPFTDHFLRY
jgi:hypothetical protein